MGISLLIFYKSYWIFKACKISIQFESQRMKSFFRTLCLLFIFLFMKIKCQDEDPVFTITRIRASNLTEIREYANMLEDFECYRFHPTMTEPFDVREFNVTLLIPIMTAYGNGEIVELCEIKDDDDGDDNKRKKRAAIQYYHYGGYQNLALAVAVA